MMNQRMSFVGREASLGDGQFAAQVWRRQPNGTTALVDVDFGQYRKVPRGARGQFMLHGWGVPYETPSSFSGEMVKRVRAEYKILKLPGHEDLEGFFFDQQYPVPKMINHEKSKLGSFLAALLGRAIMPGEPIEPDEFIGTTFVTSTTRDEVGDRVYCGISWEVIDPAKTKLSPHVGDKARSLQAGVPTSELVGVGAAVRPPIDIDDDPFADDLGL